MTPSIHAELEYIYDDAVVPGGLRGTLAHPPLTCWIIRDGRVDLTFSGEAPPLRGAGGDALFLPGIPRTHRMTPGTRLLSCRFHLSSSSGELPWRNARAFRIREGTGTLAAIGETLAALSARMFGTDPVHGRYPHGSESPPEADTALRWTSAFADWIREFLRITGGAGWEPVLRSAERPTVDRTLDLMEREGWQSAYKGEDLADAFGISLSQFKRRFRQETGLPFKQWLDRERLRQVTRELEAGHHPLKRIAYDYGFSSPSHFSAWYRRRTGISPLAYRNSAARVGI